VQTLETTGNFNLFHETQKIVRSYSNAKEKGLPVNQEGLSFEAALIVQASLNLGSHLDLMDCLGLRCGNVDIQRQRALVSQHAELCSFAFPSRGKLRT
jgi:hypothetical protein